MTTRREQQGGGVFIHAPVASTSAISRHSLDINPLVDAGLRSRPASPALSEDGEEVRGVNRSQLHSSDSYSKSKKRGGPQLNGFQLHGERSASSNGQLETSVVNGIKSTGSHVPYSNGHSQRAVHPLAATSNASSGRSTPQTGFSTLLDTPRYDPRKSHANLLEDDSLASERSPLLSVEVDRPSTPSIQQREYLRIPHDWDVDFNIPSFISTERGGQIKPPTLRSRIKLQWSQFWANAISTAFLLFIVLWALTQRSLQHIINTLLGKNKAREPRPWDNPEKWKKEKLVKDVKYYARSCGYDIIDQTLTTEDGYHLRVHKVIAPSQIGKLHSDGKGGFPVIIQHGLFQSSGSFVTSEERSLAFWLAEHGGYQVYLSNGRAVFDMGHTSLKRSDPRFWDYNIRELALYDLPAVVEHVKKETGYDKVAFIGHSQGNATMFVSLARGMLPSLGESLSVFIALAPAVYSGPLTHGFPFTAIKHMDWKKWKRIFGVLDFIPIMTISYNWTPSLPFALLGYQMFAFLFRWTDANWLHRRKPKMFRFTPSPVPSAGIFWWTGLNGFSSRGCVLNEEVDRWYEKSFPPLALYHGGKDYLVLCDPLLERLRTREPDVQVIRVHKLDDGEHCDNFWHVDAVENTFVYLLEDIEKTRPRYPEEML